MEKYIGARCMFVMVASITQISPQQWLTSLWPEKIILYCLHFDLLFYFHFYELYLYTLYIEIDRNNKDKQKYRTSL